MRMERDTQRSRLYVADDVLRPRATPLPEIADMERFVRKVWKSKRLAADYPKAFDQNRWKLPKVKDGRGRTAAGGWYGGITMPKWSRKTDVVIHELAHCITEREFGSHVAGHGWQFCSVYLRMVSVLMGREAHDELKASFKAHRVKFRAPRAKRKLSPEQRAAAIARLSVYNGTAATEAAT